MIKKFTIKGLVQGIGYRPFVAKLADELNIDGWVRNTGGIVTVLAKADEVSLNKMLDCLNSSVPTGGFINSIQVEQLDEGSISVEKGFVIKESDGDRENNLPLIPADICTCENCKKELFDKNNRRYLHPFISCTICGPRYSIIEGLPYDRDTITMKDFAMCPDCKNEYTHKLDIRRHAQTIACRKCGPALNFTGIAWNEGNLAKSLLERNIGHKFLEDLENREPMLAKAAKLILYGGILAIKDIGGYHLACTPFSENTVASLRVLKHREEKAFAVMFENLECVKKYCNVNDKEAELLESAARPIVLLKKKDNTAHPLAQNVCLKSHYIGVMLPCNPVQMILSRLLGPLIMTSGNSSGDVLETDDSKMIQWMKERSSSGEMDNTPLGVLSHNRRILRPMDDSVMKVVNGSQQFIRRARGYVPNPINVNIAREHFGAGGDLKSSFCFVKDNLAYVSQYLGDMESASCQVFYKNEQQAMKNIFGFNPSDISLDSHPGYFSRKNGFAYATDNHLNAIDIQHHKAHVASVIAEHNLKEKVLGFAFDGTGFGDDGNIWGSEAFIWDGKSSMRRVAHLNATKLIGGNEGAKNCDTILTGFLHSLGLDEFDSNPGRAIVCAGLDNNINTIKSTSMGRLFDAVSALLDICHYNSYEGQAPVWLEYEAAKATTYLPLHIGLDGDCKELFKDLITGLKNCRNISEIARGFIIAVSDYIVGLALLNKNLLDDNNQIVLGGGTFLNSILLEDVFSKLKANHFNVYTSEQLPPGDGGLSLGQVYLAAHKNLEL